MVENIKDFGIIIECMEMAHINGEMEENMLDNTLWIKKMVEEHFIIQMEISIKVCGKMGYKMD